MPDAALSSLDQLLAAGATAVRAVAEEVRSRIRRLARRGLDLPEIVERTRKHLARHEPILSRVVSDALIAAWVAGVNEIGSELPAKQSLRPLGWEPDEPPLPRNPIASSGEEGEPPPVVRFPAIEAAARGLLAKRVVTREEFDTLTRDAKRAAFTVAKVASLDALEKVQQAAALAVEGETLEEFAERVADAVGGSVLSPGHVELTLRNNVMGAYTVGLMDVLRDPLVSDEFPYLDYAAVHDSRARPEHLAMETLGIGGSSVYRRDDPIWADYLPPWGHG
jgi:BMFP domain-containing protein YqiC